VGLERPRAARLADLPSQPKVASCWFARSLTAQIRPNRGRQGRYKYSFPGKKKLMALGIYPDVPLAAASRLHDAALQLLASGVERCLFQRMLIFGRRSGQKFLIIIRRRIQPSLFVPSAFGNSGLTKDG
jgi:hypothetical protein